MVSCFYLLLVDFSFASFLFLGMQEFNLDREGIH